MPDIFLSYNREDQDRAELFARVLEAEGHSVWWDVGIKTGEAYDEVTENALRSAKAVIVLWSKKSAASRWVRAEATLAQRLKTFFPCMIEPCERPVMFELTQTADLSHWRGAADDPAWRVFAADLKRFMDGGEIVADDERERILARQAALPRSIKLDRRTAIIGGGAAAAGAGALAFMTLRTPALAKNGVAVLPFRNLSGDAAQDYLSEGLAAQVRAALARNSALRVVAQASCEAIRKRTIGAAEMAKALAVSYLLDGNLLIDEGRVKVSAELIDGKSGFSKWSQSFDFARSELSLVQDAITSAVASALSLGKSAADATGTGATKDSTALDYYLKGNELYALAKDDETDLEALSYFNRATARDTEFADAFAAKAQSLTSLGNNADNATKAALYYESAVKAALRAIEIAPSSPEAYSSLGFVRFQAQLLVKDAREPYERSVMLGGGLAGIVARFAVYAAAVKRANEAKSSIERARNLDPLNPTIHRGVGFVHYAAGRYAASIAAVEDALALNPNLGDSHARIASALIALNRPEEALEEAKKEKSLLVGLPVKAIAARMIGDDAAADAAMNSLKAAYGDAGLYQQAQVLARWGKTDEAMSVLAHAKMLNDSGLTYAYIDPALDSLRARDSFNELLKTLGFI